MSGLIQTVLGPIPAAELGPTDSHDHLIAAPPAPYAAEDPDLVLQDEAAALAELQRFRAAGGGAVIEFTTVDYHRDAAALRRLAAASGVQIIAVAGFNKGKFSRRLLAGRTVAEVTEQVLRDFRPEGIDGTGVIPGAVKAATSLNQMTPEEETGLRVAARVHRATGVPVMTHTEAGTFAHEQLDLLTAEGVPAGRITLCHMDRNLDFDYLRSVARRGCFLSFDQIGKQKYAPDTARAAMIAQLVRAGHGRQLLIGGDYARRSYWHACGGRLGPAYLLQAFVPLLRAAGLNDDEIAAILVHNPRRALTVG